MTEKLDFLPGNQYSDDPGEERSTDSTRIFGNPDNIDEHVRYDVANEADEDEDEMDEDEAVVDEIDEVGTNGDFDEEDTIADDDVDDFDTLDDDTADLDDDDLDDDDDPDDADDARAEGRNLWDKIKDKAEHIGDDLKRAFD
jgi:hypothetical protein